MHGIVLYLVACFIFAASLGVLLAVFTGVYFVLRRLNMPLRILIAVCATVALYFVCGSPLMSMLGEWYRSTHQAPVGHE
jgi:hypothetical protein